MVASPPRDPATHPKLRDRWAKKDRDGRVSEREVVAVTQRRVSFTGGIVGVRNVSLADFKEMVKAWAFVGREV